jgi:hypothetical protein
MDEVLFSCECAEAMAAKRERRRPGKQLGLVDPLREGSLCESAVEIHGIAMDGAEGNSLAEPLIEPGSRLRTVAPVAQISQ